MTRATCSKPDQVLAQDGISLADQEIKLLLHEAEDRLQGCNVSNPEIPNFNQVPGTISEHRLMLARIPKISHNTAIEPYFHQRDDVALVDTARLFSHKSSNTSGAKQISGEPLKSTNSRKMKPTAGGDWFDLPKTELTAELRRDLQLLRMRSVLDPKRHYKKESGKAHPPPYSQIGTVIEGPTEFFSGRIVKKDRKKTFVDEALALERETKRFETKYRDIQTTKQSGKKSFYKSLRSKRNTRGK
ncbi:Fcf2 domain-containing protein [Aspergillus saccharolyticus JOP 1030-1]|uniref:Putative nucleolus protein required for cell viability n=1 Tax=Aspergillus saccharolyticus JOP 1030-1 TaxID=1450539 RepID=A0A319APB4_9EURO|nr:putative nucleolus protein required for cell viability [Aspergillus saccharolyticus JOP 1030-1]PYH48302.1 putative nucleolus protein required for cell viability [Aspergillus saccharolyticus JOP 1030-1]